MSRIRVERFFQCSAAETVKAFSLLLVLGTHSCSLSTARRVLVCTSDGLIKCSLMYSEAKPFMALYASVVLHSF